MYSIQIIFKSAAAVGYYFLKYYKAKKIIDRYSAWKADALKAAETYQSDNVHLLSIEDDYGSIGIIDFNDVSCVNLSDINKREEQNGDIQIIVHKSKLEANKKWQRDPDYKNPPIIQPAHSLITN